jgi:two-component system sensor histidine kinase KdpD
MQRLESGFLEAKLDWCEINELINTPISRLSKELETHTIEKSIQEDFPIIKLDFGLIEQALFNILHNASVYTPDGSTISISCGYENNQLIIVVADTGKGFTEVELNSLFTRFYRVNKSDAGGVGLGLSIAKGFVESHNGQLTVENNVPHGAKFTIKIPCDYYELNDELDFSDITLKETIHHEHKNEYPDH